MSAAAASWLGAFAAAGALTLGGCKGALESPAEGPRPKDTGCIECHAEAASDVAHSLQHADLECRSCHTGSDHPEAPAETKECTSCHRDVELELALPFTHPQPDGCTTCHEPHGSTRREVREDLREETCKSCHMEVRGPFLFEHDGERGRACMSCHRPHAATNRRLLTYADSRSLCMSCHFVLEGVHIQNPGAIYNDCLTCHTEVHGSNWSRELYR